MSLRTIALALVTSVLIACGGGATATDEPTTAKDKQRRDADEGGDAGDGGDGGDGDKPGKWGGWRYTGDRNECFFVVGRRCFKTEDAACTAARCGKKKCEVTGGGPASVACAK
jgi:hypothetical protein